MTGVSAAMPGTGHKDLWKERMRRIVRYLIHEKRTYKKPMDLYRALEEAEGLSGSGNSVYQYFSRKLGDDRPKSIAQWTQLAKKWEEEMNSN